MNPIGGQTPSNMIIALILLTWSGLGYSATSNNHQSTNLFDGDRNVISLNGTSFEAAVLNQKHITICAFYSHWCAHCQRKMPIISELAKSIKSWKQVVQIAGVNAAVNYKLARKINVNYYPKFYYVPAKSLELDQIRPLNLAPTSPDKLKTIVLDLIKKDNTLLQLYSLNPILVYQKSDLCSMLSDVDRSVEQFIIVERNPSDFSLMLLLELMPYKDTMQIRRIYGDDHLLQSLVTSPIDKIAILRIGQGSCSFELFMMNPNHEIDAVKSKFSPFIHADSEEINNEIVPDDNAVAKKVVRYKLSYVDLYNALRHALLIEVPMVKVFNEKQVRVLKQFFIMIHKYFPFRNENVKRLFKRMNIWFEKKTSNVSSDDYLAKMGISDGFLVPMESWRHCNGSEPKYRGYTCGLWVLFHTLTVNEYNMTLTRDNALMDNSKPKHEVLFAVRDYITTFFSCKECRDNFVVESSDMEQHLHYANSSVLWLWKTHNHVNHRLQGQVGEDPFFPKIQFPSAEQCDECYDDNHSYNRPSVLKFMTHYYGKEAIRNSSPSSFCLSMFFTMFVVIQSLRILI